MKFLIVTFAFFVSASAYPNEVHDVKHGHGSGHHHNQEGWEVPVEFVPLTTTTTTTTTTTLAPTTVTTTASAPSASASADPDVKPTIVEPSKFDNILNVTWSPDWNPASYFNFSDFQGNVQEKLGSLANLPFNTAANSNGPININVGTTGTTGTTALTQEVSSSVTSLITVITSYLAELTNLVNIDVLVNAGTETLTSVASSTTTALTAAYHYLGVVLFPTTVVGVFIVGTYMIIYMIVQVCAFVIFLSFFLSFFL